MSKRILVDKLFVEEDVGFSCRACQYRTNQKRRLIQHIHCIHHNGPVAKCDECGSLHKNAHALQAHVYRSHRDAWGASNLPTSHAKPPVQRDTQCLPPPPPPTPQPTNRPVKERWVLNNSTTGSHTTSGDKRSERTHPSDEILSGRFNSGRVFKTSRVVCQVCKRWFRSRFDLANHQKSICAPATKTLGF